MRHIVQQAPLAIHGFLQAVSHAIEIAAEIGEFIVTRTDRRDDAGTEIPPGHGGEGVPQAAYGLRDIPGQAQCGRQARQQGRHDRDPRGAVPAVGFVDGKPSCRGHGVRSRDVQTGITPAGGVPARLGQFQRTDNHDDDRDLRQPDEGKEFPKQAAQIYSFKSWYP